MQWFCLGMLCAVLASALNDDSVCLPDIQAPFNCTLGWYLDDPANALFAIDKQLRCQYDLLPHIVEVALQGTAKAHVKNLNDHYEENDCPSLHRWHQDKYRQESCCADSGSFEALEKCTFQMPSCLYKDEVSYEPESVIEIVLQSNQPFETLFQLEDFFYEKVVTTESVSSLLKNIDYTHIGVAGEGRFVVVYLSKGLGSEICNQCYCAPTPSADPSYPTTPTTTTTTTTTSTTTPTTTTQPPECITTPPCRTTEYCEPRRDYFTKKLSLPLRILNTSRQKYEGLKDVLRPYLNKDDALVKEIPEDVWRDAQYSISKAKAEEGTDFD